MPAGVDVRTIVKAVSEAEFCELVQFRIWNHEQFSILQQPSTVYSRLIVVPIKVLVQLPVSGLYTSQERKLIPVTSWRVTNTEVCDFIEEDVVLVEHGWQQCGLNRGQVAHTMKGSVHRENYSSQTGVNNGGTEGRMWHSGENQQR